MIEPYRRRWLKSLGFLSVAAVVPGLASCERRSEPGMPHAAGAASDPNAAGSSPRESVAQWVTRQIRAARREKIVGGFVGAAFERGHRLRQGDLPAPGVQQKTRVAIVGTGITALSVARQLRAAGVRDYRLFELEDSVGGNSRSGRVAGLSCPWGAHYLPVPDPNAAALRELMVELGLATRDGERLIYDEKVLCHAPQERLLVDGSWQQGLLPPSAPGGGAAADYRRDLARFANLIASHRESGLFQLGAAPRADLPSISALDQQTFRAWLDALQLNSTPLRWYLDYCCRDDYGAGIEQVSAWAGIHYFASRHGFFDSEEAREEEKARGDLSEVLTWPEGNGWLAEQMARPHRRQIVTGALVSRVGAQHLDVWRASENITERWQADHIVLAVPLFVAAHLLEQRPAALDALLPRLSYASWRVANVYLGQVPQELPGAPRAWDNVMYGDLGSGGLGYVDAMHQSLRSRPGPTVLTSYFAMGPGKEARTRLLESAWSQQAGEVLDHLQRAHVDIRDQARRLDIMRWGHAMVVPVPGLRTDPALVALREPFGTLRFAHTDLAGYSVFEEAFAIGTRVGAMLAGELVGRS